MHWVCRPLVLLLLLAGLLGAAYEARCDLCYWSPKDFVRNPHLLMAGSCFSGKNFALTDGTPDVADFLPGQAQVTPDLLQKRPKNVILIVLESSSVVYLDLYGGPHATTPNLRALQSKSVVFDNFYSTATHTIASALPLFGSTYNDNTTLATVISHPDFPTPAASSWLKKQGYHTYFLGSGGKSVWQNYRNLGPAFLPLGFDLSRDGYRHWSEGERPWPFNGEDHLDAGLFADASRVLQEVKNDKFFLMMWNYETHEPYPEGDGPRDWDESKFPPAIATDAERTGWYRNYLRCVWRVDRLLGNLYHELETLGLADDTLVVLTADHGEAFGQHGWFLHGNALYEEDVHVPLVFLAPRLAHLGPRRSVAGSHIDLWPTILDVLGLPADPLWQGRSLFAESPPDERRAYFYRNGALGLRQGKYKYIWDYEDERELLFDLDCDPKEARNLAGQHQPFCDQQRRRLKDWTNFQREWTKERVR